MKILFIRFSSIGDIVLTTPLIRCAKEQIKGAEIHYVTKNKFAAVIGSNPYIDKLITIEDSVGEISELLKKEQYDFVADLHKNIRSKRLVRALGAPSKAFDKLNYQKWMLVNLKINKMPDVHIVDRYFETISSLGIKNDNKGLDYFIPPSDEIEIKKLFPVQFENGFHSLVVGGSYYTKQIPVNKLEEIIAKSNLPVALLGGKEDGAIGRALQEKFGNKVWNGCGEINLNGSASIIRQSQKVITSDTGLMHIAAAFNKEIHSLWGNTIPGFGMYPYLPGKGSKMHEVKGLSCRPCSKLGYKACPKKHFKCMNEIKTEEIFV